jgi:xylulokinase
MGYLIGYDIGSSSVKASLVDINSGVSKSTVFYPKSEAEIIAKQKGWAEQNPNMWWKNLKLATNEMIATSGIDVHDIKAIGISYQMHGLVCIDKNREVLRPAIIWCDSRAVPYGQHAFEEIGQEKCMQHLLNSPGNFTVSKLAWVKNNEPDVYARIYKAMLPGDYIAMKLTDEINTTIPGLSEGILWDFENNCIAQFVLDYFGIDSSIIPQIGPTFGEQGQLTKHAADELGLIEGILVTYRAGDQPNNALSLNVLNPGEIASTAGTSGVIYGICDTINYDKRSRVNTFAHVNHTKSQTRLGVLLCINGTGICNAWMRRNIALADTSYNDMNVLAQKVPIGCEGLSVLPFGNGAERVLCNKEIGCSLEGINFNLHDRSYLIRAAQEGVVYSLVYGMEILKQIGVNIDIIHAGMANMFLNPVFREALSCTSHTTIELYDTDGSVGAAKGAGLGAKIYQDNKEAFSTLQKLSVIEPDESLYAPYETAYQLWKERLNKHMTEEK